MTATRGIALIQGASRGIGLQFCKTLLQRNPTTTVIATCRNPKSSPGLGQLKDSNPANLHVCKLDVTKEEEIVGVSKFVTDSFGRLDLFINCAGMLHPSGKGETSLRSVDEQVYICIWEYFYSIYMDIYICMLQKICISCHCQNCWFT